MNKHAKIVKDYWMQKSNLFQFDSEVLDACVQTLTPDERGVLLLGDSKTDKFQHEDFVFVVTKVFNRHTDVCDKKTFIKIDDDGDMSYVITPRASITELNIDLATLENCNKHFIYHIDDARKEALPALDLQAIAELTRAIIEYNYEVAEYQEN